VDEIHSYKLDVLGEIIDLSSENRLNNVSVEMVVRKAQDFSKLINKKTIRYYQNTYSTK
jgi:hypothetical protein